MLGFLAARDWTSERISPPPSTRRSPERSEFGIDWLRGSNADHLGRAEIALERGLVRVLK